VRLRLQQEDLGGRVRVKANDFVRFRYRQGARPFYDLVANIAAEEFGHIELVATAINTMLTGTGEEGALPDPEKAMNPQQFIAGGAAALAQDSNGKPWNATTSRPPATSWRT